MLYNTLHNRWLRILMGVVGCFISALSLNVFIVPQGLYTGGLLGFCQVIRTLLYTHFGIGGGSYDLAGVLYAIFNIPLFLLAYKALGRDLLLKTVICTVAYSFFYSVIPIPSEPVVEDMLTSCLLGGIFTGIGSGLILTCGCSGGGLDVVGLYLSKKGSNFTVGRFNLGFNVVLYSLCLFLFEPAVAIYSVIYNFFTVLILDRMHQQNINVQALIFTREQADEMSHYIMDTLHRGVTYWDGVGAYTGTDVKVLCVCLSKYEIEELRHAVHHINAHAFIIFQEGVHIDGNFPRKIGDGD